MTAAPGADLAIAPPPPTLSTMATTFQPPPGTRDFYPEEMALRRYIEDTWRRVSLRHGFVEVDGPTFEFLDLYKVKSGDEIVSQLFHFESRGEDKKEFALRPEFTPTLARMVAAKANSLPRPIKWFSIPRCYRAERPQKGRLREFIQWNVDMLGGETPEARRQFDLEVAALTLDCLREFGLANTDIVLLWNDRTLVEQLFTLAGVPGERFAFAFYLLDRVAKLAPELRKKLYDENSLTDHERTFFEQLAAGKDPLVLEFWPTLGGPKSGLSFENYMETIAGTQEAIEKSLALAGLPGFARYDASIVRGLAYYTGFVWEISAAQGEHRAVAGGGRYDKLIEMFGGPPLPATGFGMGDVVLANLLEETGKLPTNLARLAAPDVFIVNALPDSDEALKLIGQLRAAKFAVAASYKTTKNIGKLLQEASASGARFALILAPTEWGKPGGPFVKLKNLATRDEQELPASEIIPFLRPMTA
jgi:histidyl-tRNA synthetase